MTQAELNRAVAVATGESVRTIAEMGFVELAAIPVEWEPLVVNWDELDAERVSVLSQRRRSEPIPA